MADRDFVVKNGLRTVGNSFVANSSTVTVSANLVINGASINANGTNGTAGQLLTSNGSSVYWSTAGVNTTAQYTYSNNMTFNGAVLLANTLSANGSTGGAGQVLTSAGFGQNVYWSTLVGVNTAAQYTFSNTINFANTISLLSVSANSSTGNPGQVLSSNGSGTYWATLAGVSASGANTQVQFNDSGAINATSGLTFNKNTNTLTVGTASVNSTIYTGSSLTANDATNLGGAPSTSYVNTSGSYTLSGNITFNGNVAISRALSTNGSFGTAGQALFSGGTANAYWGGVVTSVAVSSGQLTASFSGLNPTLGLATTAVTPGSYTLASITVDSYGRVTAASNGTGGGSGITAVNGTAGRITASTVSGTATIDLASAGAGSGSYGGSGISSLTLDAYGRVTSIGTATYTTTASLASASVSYATSAGSAGSASSASFTTGGTSGSSYNVYCNNLYASAEVYAYYSDLRLKTNIKLITNALDKINQISGIIYNSNDVAAKYGYSTEKEHVGVIAQEIQTVLPQAVGKAPFDIDEDGNSKSGENYLTVQYDKLVPLLIEGIKELSQKVSDLEKQVEVLKGGN